MEINDLFTNDDNFNCTSIMNESAQNSVLEHTWTLVASSCILLMQVGFAFIETGSVRKKNKDSVLVKTILDICVGCFGWALIGFGIAFGIEKNGGFLGTNTDCYVSLFYFRNEQYAFMTWIFYFSFACNSSTIISGAIAERTSLKAYMIITFLQTSFIYSVCISWNWGGGWLYKISEDIHFKDFAGCTTVHLVGGAAALWGAMIVGRRIDKDILRNEIEREHILNQIEIDKKSCEMCCWSTGLNLTQDQVEDKFRVWYKKKLEEEESEEFQPNNISFIILGTIILWIAWLFFNGGTAHIINISDNYEDREELNNYTAARVICNTSVSASFAGVSSLIFKPIIMKYLLPDIYEENKFDYIGLCNGIICGLVSISACCDSIGPPESAIIGTLAAIFYSFGVVFINKIKLDDVVESVPVHLFGGIWGTIAAGLFDNVHGIICFNTLPKECERSGAFFGIQLVGIISLFAWSSVLTIGQFLIMKRMKLLRIPYFQECIGIDRAYLGGITSKMWKQIVKQQEIEGSVEDNIVN